MEIKKLTELLDQAEVDLADVVIPELPLDEPAALETSEEEVKTDETREQHLTIMLTKAIAEEEEAVASYLKKAAKCDEHGETDLAKMFNELANDEKVHAGQLRKALELLGLKDEGAELEGAEEAENALVAGPTEEPELTPEFNESLKALPEDIDIVNSDDVKFRYMMLDRLRQDCDCYLDRPVERHLWADNVEDQIKLMYDLYNTFEEKPEWCTLDDIKNYEKLMLAKKAEEEAKA